MLLLKQIIEEVLLYEGLDITHNSKLSANKLNLWWNFDGSVEFQDIGVKIHMYFRKEISKENLDIILKFINNLGYFPAVMALNSKLVKFDYDDVVKHLSYPKLLSRIDFEPKFDPEILEREIPDMAYHIAPTQNEEKILELGLAPKNKEKISKHPPRIYLSTSVESVEILAQHPTFKKNKSLTIFGVDLGTLKKVRKIKWFSDPNFDDEGGFYTLENIPPKYIKVVKRISNSNNGPVV